MGQNKALLSIDGVPIIARIHTLFEKLFKEVIIVSDQPKLFSHLSARIYPDLIPGRGALGGLYTGLYFSSFPFSFSVACDMPFLKESLIHFLLRGYAGFDIVVPRTDDGLQPLHAVYSRDCLDSIKRLLDAGNCKITDLYHMVRVNIVDEIEFLSLDPQRRSFMNVNTPEELNLARKMIESS